MPHYYKSADIGGVRMLVFHHRKPQNGDRYRFRPMIALVALLPSRAERFYNIFQDTFQTKIITGSTSGPFFNKIYWNLELTEPLRVDVGLFFKS